MRKPRHVPSSHMRDCACLTPFQAAICGPADYVFLPAVTYGEREIDFKSGTWRKSGADRQSAASIGFGYA